MSHADTSATEFKRTSKIMLIKVLVGKPLGRTSCRWEDNIRMNHREAQWACVTWLRVAQNRDQLRTLVNTLRNFRFP